MAFLPFMVSVLSGWLLVRLAAPTQGMQPRWAAALAEAALGAGAGAGLGSFLYFFLLLAGAASPAAILLLHGAVLLSLGTLVWRRRTRTPQAAPAVTHDRPPYRWNWVIVLVLGACLIPILVTEIEGTRSNPHGGWDAWAIWNLRARYLAGPGETWRNAISPMLTRTHPDYPLLLSSFIAHNWKFAGGAPSIAVPIATTFLFGVSVVVLAIASLSLLRGTSLGLLAGLPLMANQLFLLHLASQFSDVPLALYYLGALLAVFLSDETGRSRGPVLALAGYFVSLAAWCKDEGLVFALVFLACFAAFEWRAGGWRRLPGRLGWTLAGALPGLLVVAGFKLLLAPQANPMMAQNPAQAVVRLLAPERWWNLVQGLFLEAGEMGHGLYHPLLILAVLAAALGLNASHRRRSSAAFGGVTLAVVLAAYCAALLVNPTLLGVPRATPLSRMYSQLWPSFVVIAFLPLRAPEEMAPAATPGAKKGKKKRKG